MIGCQRMMLYFSALVLLVAQSVKADRSFVYDGYGYSGCGSNVYGIQLQSLEIGCPEGFCDFGSEVMINGTCELIH
jgi:hypothetical protein